MGAEEINIVLDLLRLRCQYDTQSQMRNRVGYTDLMLRRTTWVGDQFSHLVVSNSLQPHGLQHARVPYPSPTPGTY